MRQGNLTCLALWLLAAAPVWSQTLPDDAAPQPYMQCQAPVAAFGAPAICDMSSMCCCQNDCSRIWARGEYLLWWVKDAPMPVPIVTTGDPNVGFNGGVGTVNTAGAIGQPGTQVLFGDSSVNFHTFSGTRFVLGGWFDDEQLIGVEGTGFLLERRSSQFTAASNGTGEPPLYFPINSLFLGAPAAVPIADPLRQFSGNVSATSSLRLWGAEFNGCTTVWTAPGLEVALLAGFRYADLMESFQIENTTNDLLLLDTQVLTDRFDTRNQFYGGQLGTRISWQCGRLAVDLTGKVALGSTHEVVNIQGEITQTPLLPPASPGGIYTQQSNIGRFHMDQFTVLPTVELKVGYQITRWLRAFAGYDFMFWNQVVRPGSQINPNVNLTQNGILDPNGVGTLVGQAQPTPLFNRSDFWAQGVSFGLEFCF